jgi:NADPH:quinone reductase-like Zn-dependent oxidoreductase
MRAVRIARPGGYDRLQLVELSDPRPGPGEVRVATSAAGVNFADVVVRLGLYKSAKEYVGWPITPGFEFAGEVAELGPGVSDLAVGERVFGVTRFGGYASQLCVARAQLFRVPEGMSLLQAATFPTVFLTAHYALREIVRLRPGARVLIHAAAGGVGLAALQLCRALSCEAVGVVGAPHKRELAHAFGAAHVIDKSSEPLWPRAQQLAPRGFDVVLDSNGVETLAQSYAHLRPTGRLVVYGFHSMLRRGQARASWLKLAWDYLRTPRFHPLQMVDANKGVIAFNLSYLFSEQALLVEAMQQLLHEVSERRIAPLPVREFPMAAAAEAHRELQSGSTTGKLALVP